jgi:hypothetical protein
MHFVIEIRIVVQIGHVQKDKTGPTHPPFHLLGPAILIVTRAWRALFVPFWQWQIDQDKPGSEAGSNRCSQPLVDGLPLVLAGTSGHCAYLPERVD